MRSYTDWFSELSWLQSTQVFGNTLAEYLTALGVFAAGLLVFRLCLLWVLARLEKLAAQTHTAADDVFIRIIRSVKPPFSVFLSIYVAAQFLTLHPFLSQVLSAVLIMWATYQVLIAAHIGIDFFAQQKATGADSSEVQSAVGALKLLSKILLWSIGVLLVLSNMGINITSLVAGLGIGGIAVALAVQSILGDLLSSFAIYFDKPFKIGDFIVTGDTMGTVEKIGVKTTRIRALQGEEIVLPNQQLTSARVQNYKQMESRRVVFTFGIEYETPLKSVRAVPGMIEQIIAQQEHATFDRAHFFAFGDSALTFEVVYHVTVSDYAVYMDTQQAINLSILEQFEKHKISMAYPTRTLHLFQK